jgi:hypothetical protein
MPPEAISERSSYWRSIMGIITEAWHLVQVTVPNGARSPGMNCLAPHAGQETIFRAFF